MIILPPAVEAGFLCLEGAAMDRLLTAFKISRKNMIRLFIFVIAALMMYFMLFDSGFSLEWFQDNISRLNTLSQNHLLLSIVIFLLVRYIFAVISIPGTGVLSIVGGAIFNFWLAVALVSLSVNLGVLTVFLLSRYAFKDPAKKRFAGRFHSLEQLLDEYGASLLFLLRLSELCPSFIINSFFAFTPVKTFTFLWVSFIGHLPGIIIFVNAGRQINEINKAANLMDPRVILSLVALGLIPLLSKFLHNRILCTSDNNCR
ncbi:TVP38/TMEM64 family protein [Halarsenatibacter silvermanii]|nr:VTT domain-containing protein [Halarsenatibacter silvermanii]